MRQTENIRAEKSENDVRPNEQFDQPNHSHSLIRIFIGRI